MKRLLQLSLALSFILMPLSSWCTNIDTIHYTVYMGSREAGSHQSWTNEDGDHMYHFTFNDRGRGPDITEQIQLDGEGRLQMMAIYGHDYTKNQVKEKFWIEDGQGHWSSASDEGSQDFQNQFYYPINGTIASKEVLIKMIQKQGRNAIPLLPFGRLSIDVKESYQVGGHSLILYGLGGISYAPSFYWMDDQEKLFAVVSPSRGISCIRRGAEDLKGKLIEIQKALEDAYFRGLAKEVSQVPSSATAITNVAIFDAHRGIVETDKTLVFEKNVITEIYDEPNPTLAENVSKIDGTGKTLLPGLFDMHVHIGKSDGILHIAGGVTSVRDMAVQTNYVADKQQLRDDFNGNVLMGPRIVRMCGFIDGMGPFTRDKGIDSVSQGLQWIDEFNGAGIKQIKLYSSIKPEWVKPLAERAHQYDMVVSGHIPAFMTATQAIKEGYDEIQHTNMLFLNFYGDTLDTRNMTRFSAVGEQGHQFDFDGKKFTDFVALLKEEDIIIDPTLAIFEWGFRSVSGQASPTYEKIVHRLPLSNRRQYYTGGFARPPGMHQKYLDSYDRMLKMIYELHSRGVRIVPGTDNLPGFAYHREMELYVDAGIAPGEVLQLATLRSAQVAGVADRLGSLDAGKLADMVLVDGNPLEDISTIRNTVITVKDGIIYDPKKLYESVGVAAQ